MQKNNTLNKSIMVSGTQTDNTNMSDQHRRRLASSSPKLFVICGTVMLLYLINSTSAQSGSGEQHGAVQTIQQLRSRGQSGEQFRSRLHEESAVMMTKTSPVVAAAAPVAVTEVYGRDSTQVIAPTNATISDPAEQVKRSASEPEYTWASRIKRLVQSQGFQKMVMGNFVNMSTKQWLPTGNDLWDGILGDCPKNPSFSCMQKNVYTYLDRTLLSKDLNVTENFLFLKNQVNYTDELVRASRFDIDPESHGRSMDEDEQNEAGKRTLAFNVAQETSFSLT